MTHEAKKAIRMDVQRLDWGETIQLMAMTGVYIKEYASRMNVIKGLDGMRKQIKKNIDIEIAAYRMECAARHLQRMARTEQDKLAQSFIDGVFNFGA